MGIVDALKAEIDSLEAKASKLREVLADVFSADGLTKRNGRRRKKAKKGMSAAGRKRLSNAMKARWASGKMGRRKAKRNKPAAPKAVTAS